MYSFYGGRPGNSFIIVRTFTSQNDMIENFRKGPDYTEVHYDQYVLINTVDKWNPQNGKIYKRGYNYNDEKGGAIQIGTIVGPSGPAPHFHLLNSTDYERKKNSDEFAEIKESVYENSTQKPYLNLIPGSESGGDKITWKLFSGRDREGNDANVYASITIPYPVIDLKAKPIDSYDSLGNILPNTKELITYNEQDSRPFYYKYTLDIPKGIKGNSIEKIEIVDYNATTKKIRIDNKDENIINITSLPSSFIAREKPYKIFVAKILNYDENNTGIASYYYLGQYNIPISCTVNKDGDFIQQYTNGQLTTDQKKIKWIDQINFDNNTGLLAVKFNNEDEVKQISTEPIKYINWMQLNEDGKIQIRYNTSKDDDEEVYINENYPISWLRYLQMNEDGYLQIQRNTSDNWETINPYTPIKWPQNIALSSDQSTLQITWNDDSTTNLAKNLMWMEDIKLNENGILQIKYNNEEYTKDINQDQPIKWIKRVYMNENQQLVFEWNNESIANTVTETIGNKITDVRINPDPNFSYTKISQGLTEQEQLQFDNAGKIAYQINNEEEYTSIGEPINSIEKIGINERNEILVYYSSPQKRYNGTNDVYKGQPGWDYVGNLTTNFSINAEEGETFPLEWVGTGQIIEQSDIDSNLGVITIKFTIPPSYFIDRNISAQVLNMTLSMQEKKSSNARSFQDQKYINQNDTQNPFKISVMPTLAGMQFTIYDISNSLMTPQNLGGFNQKRQSFCDISISNLQMHFNYDHVSTKDQIKLFTGRYLEYDWDSKTGWSQAATNGRTPAECRRGQAIINPTTGKFNTNTIPIDRPWNGAYYIDLIRPEPLRKEGVHIVSAQLMRAEGTAPFIVYPYSPEDSHPTGDPQADVMENHISTGNGQYFRIMSHLQKKLTNSGGGGVHIVIRFLYYIADSSQIIS